MPLQKITFRPGVNKEFTPTLNEGGWSDSNLVRFRGGLPQPIGGWQSVLASTFLGVPRKIHSWATLNSVPIWSVGTTQRLYVGSDGLYYDVTPYYASVTASSALSTTSGSPSVAMMTPIITIAVGDRVNFDSVTVGGLTISGEYIVTSIGTPGTFFFNAGSNASSTATATSATVGLFLKTGPTDGVPGDPLRRAWADPMLWSLDHWGEQLIACPRDGGLYVYIPNGYLRPVQAVAITNAPLYSKFVMAAMPERHLVTFGSTPFGSSTQDPMLVCWSDVEDYTTWTATATNSAGSFRLVGGTEIIGAAAAPQQILIWTDTTLWAMRFQGLPYVYGFFQQGETCGAVSPQAMAVMNGIAYWMGRSGFFRYTGQVEPLDCTVLDDVFRNLNTAQQMKVHCAPNMGFNEVWWFYPSKAGNEIDRYAKINVTDGAWDEGALSRTAWEDAKALGSPIATDASGNLFAHETGTTAYGALLDAYVESGYSDLGDGGDIMFLDRLIPDFAQQVGTLNVTLTGRNYPNGGERAKGPYAVTSSTRFLAPRLRARQMKMRLESADTDAFWRLGAVRARIAPDGKKA